MKLSESILNSLRRNRPSLLFFSEFIHHNIFDRACNFIFKNCKLSRVDKLVKEYFLALVNFVNPESRNIVDVGVDTRSEFFILSMVLFLTE